VTATSYDVRIYKTAIYAGKRITSYRVRWKVDGRSCNETFRNSTQAKNFKSALRSAASRGEAFFVDSGRPVSMVRETGRLSWYQFAVELADLRWNGSAATSRRTDAEALTAITMQMFSTTSRMPDEKLLRRVLKLWAFNTKNRVERPTTDDERRALTWAEGHTRDVSTLSETALVRKVLNGLAVKLNGRPRAASVVTRWRKTLNVAMGYAVERKLLASNPLKEIRWTAPQKTVRSIDRRVVANPIQARSIFNELATFENGRRLLAFFGCIYYAAMRPEEAAAVGKQHLAIPADGWGDIHLDGARPFAGKEWTDTGQARDERQLKHREVGETRTVPCPPELTAMIHEHLGRYGTAPDGRLFVGARRLDYLPTRTVTLTWQRARAVALAPEAAASPLARTPYDLRHAAVSTWLAAGVPAPKVAEWAGHSVEVLLKIYAKCLDGEDARTRAKVTAALAGAV
jgi:integrase